MRGRRSRTAVVAGERMQRSSDSLEEDPELLASAREFISSQHFQVSN
jgi:hypothetical protein